VKVHGGLGLRLRLTGQIGVEGPLGTDVSTERTQNSNLILGQQVQTVVAAVLVLTQTTRMENQVRHVAFRQTVMHSETEGQCQWEGQSIRLNVKGGCRFWWDGAPRPTRHRVRNCVFERA